MLSIVAPDTSDGEVIFQFPTMALADDHNPLDPAVVYPNVGSTSTG